MTQQSETLTGFYRAYLAWVEAGLPEKNKHKFCDEYGLCSNLQSYFFSLHSNVDAGEAFRAVRYEMHEQFKAHGLCWEYPFNGGDRLSYFNGCGRGASTNTRRISWVRAHANLEGAEC